MGRSGVGKTFLASALGHISVRRGHSLHAERTDKLFKRLKAARLDGSYEDEMRRLYRVELLIIDDLPLHRLEATETSRFHELIVERDRPASTIVTSNRKPPEILALMADPLLAQWPSADCKVPPSIWSSKAPLPARQKPGVAKTRRHTPNQRRQANRRRR